MPDGHVVVLPVGEYHEAKIELNELLTDKGNNATFTHRAKVFQPSEYGISLPACVIHAIDGWVMRELRKRCKAQGFDILGVHDSFWCSPNHMNKLRQNYLDTLIWIADNNLLQDILSEILDEEIIYHKISYDLSKEMEDAEYALS